jgi:hypothetical protein
MPAKAPSGRSAILRKSSSLPTQAKTKSQSLAASAGLAALAPPCWAIQRSALPGVRL